MFKSVMTSTRVHIVCTTWEKTHSESYSHLNQFGFIIPSCLMYRSLWNSGVSMIFTNSRSSSMCPWMGSLIMKSCATSTWSISKLLGAKNWGDNYSERTIQVNFIHKVIYNVPFHFLSLKTCCPLEVEMKENCQTITITLSSNKPKLALASASCLLVITKGVRWCNLLPSNHRPTIGQHMQADNSESWLTDHQ